MRKIEVVFKPRVLVIEDDPDQSALLQKFIGSMGHEIRVAFDGKTGREIVESWKPDLVLLDKNLPDCDGLELLSEINSNPEYWDIAFIVMTADARREVIMEVMSLGAVDFFRKPFEPMELILKLDTQFKYKRAQLEADAARSQLEHDNMLLSRYFSADLIEKILSGAISAEIGGSTVAATILVLDLRGSTGIAERMSPADFAQFLSDLFEDFADIIYGHGGTIINFTGDGFVVGFGVPKSTGKDVMSAARTAIDIRRSLREYNQSRSDETDVRVGIGIASGEMFAGNVGSKHRLDYTVLGDPVNLASRLQSLTKLMESDIFIDGRTKDLLGDHALVKQVELDAVRGKLKSVRIFYLEDLR